MEVGRAPAPAPELLPEVEQRALTQGGYGSPGRAPHSNPTGDPRFLLPFPGTEPLLTPQPELSSVHRADWPLCTRAGSRARAAHLDTPGESLLEDECRIRERILLQRTANLKSCLSSALELSGPEHSTPDHSEPRFLFFLKM